jgi:hypothetical protein
MADVVPAPKRLSEACGHPLFILVLASVVSTLLVPLIAEKSDRAKQIQDARLATSRETLNNSAETEERLNALIVMIELYRKDNRNNPQWKVAQAETRKVFSERYLEFDRQAWWWISPLSIRAELLRIGVDSQTASTHLNEYKGLVVESIATLDPYWDACLRSDKVPGDPRLEKMGALTRAKLVVLQKKRGEIVGKLVHLFKPTEPNFLNALVGSFRR